MNKAAKGVWKDKNDENGADQTTLIDLRKEADQTTPNPSYSGGE